jgi:methyl-accepting chemotaxis protein
MRPRSLKYKFLVGIIALLAVFGLAVMIIIPAIMADKLQNELRKTAVYLTEEIVAESIDLLLTEQTTSLQLLLFSRREMYEDIEYIFIFNREKEVVAHTFSGLFPSGLKEANKIESDQEYKIQHLKTERGGIIDVAVPVLNLELGVLHAGFSERRINESIENIIWLIRWVIIVIMVLGGGIALVFARTLIRPVYELRKGADAIGRGELAYRVRVDTKDEIGDLAESFNAMAENLKAAKDELEESNIELRKALDQVNTLSGMLPICSYCKKIRDDKGYWKQVADYISERTGVQFSHGMCPDCAKRVYSPINS